MKNNKIDLNSAGLLTKQFINSKFTLLLIICITLFGILAIKSTPRTYNPEIIVPVVNISVSRPGSSTDEILHQIVRPLEGLMASIPGVEHTFGMATNDGAIVTVRFKVNKNEEESLVKVYNQINSNLDKMPSGTLMPLIQSISLYDVPLVTLTLHSDNIPEIELRKVAVQLLEQLRTIPQVGKSWVMGSSPKALRVWINPKKMVRHAIAINEIQDALAINNISLDAGLIEKNLQKIPLRIKGQLISDIDVGNIIVGTDKARPIFLKDIATIEYGPENEDIFSYFSYGIGSKFNHKSNLTPAVTIAIARQKGSNGVDVAKSILTKLETIKQTDIIPKSVNISITRNYGAEADDAVNTLIEHLGIAIATVVILLLVFLGWREASIVTFSIPLILFMVIGIGWLFGQTINRITLFALILSLGLLVDDSIVVIENIHRHIIKGAQDNFNKLVIFAANEIGKPTIIATFTVILALLPMGFVTGMMGPFMAPIPFNAPLAMLISLIIAYTVVPYLAYRWLRKKAEKSLAKNDLRNSNEHSWLQRFYLYIFRALLNKRFYRYSFYLLIISLLIIVMLQPAWQFIRTNGTNGPLSPFGVELKMLPDDNVNTLLLEINAGANANTNQTKKIIKPIVKTLNTFPEISDYTIYLGESAPEDFAAMVRGDMLQKGSNFSQIRINLTNKHHRKIKSHEVGEHIYKSLANIQQKYPNAHIKLFESPPGPPVRSQMEAGIFGDNYKNMQNLAQKITKKIFPHIYGMINIDNSVTENVDEYIIELNHDKTILSGLSPTLVAQNIATYFKGTNIGNIHKFDMRDPEKIILRLPKNARNNFKILNNLLIKNKLGELIPLAKIAKFKQQTKQKPIYTKDQFPVVYITGEILGSSPAYAVITATNILKNISINQKKLAVNNLGFKKVLPNNINNYQLQWFGEMRLTLDVFRDLGAAFIVAIILIYVLLTAFYQSFFIPLIIMGAIPLTIIGVFPGHWLMGQPFTATSMIGVIALAGIVVRNSLLLIDFIIEHQRSGFPLKEAVIAAGTERILPIILTALAIILGSSVMLSDPVFGGLAISLIFGSFASTILTLFLIPLIYKSFITRFNAKSH